MAYEQYNELTKRLLAEGYTAENHPDYVYLPPSNYRRQDSNDPLNNFEGGFEYYYWYAAERTYKTPCGLLCKGKFTHAGLSWMGTDYKHENDIVTIRCPKGCINCKQREEPFRSEGDGVQIMVCSVRHTTDEWRYEGSCEELQGLYNDRIRREKISFQMEHRNRVCDTQMHYDDAAQKWTFNYSAAICANGYCRANRGDICPVLNRKLCREKGNVYFDVEYEGRDYSKDGTLFEGERFHYIIKGIQAFNKPINLDIARIYANTEKDMIYHKARWNLQCELSSLELFRAERGEIDLTWSVKNIRAEKKETRDFEQDLADIEAGITVMHEFDRAKAAKAQKSQKRKEAKEKRIAAMEKKILKVGYNNLEYSDQAKADKLLDPYRIEELEIMREREEKEKAAAPKQMTIFDMFPS